jgi:hypothetical protein
MHIEGDYRAAAGSLELVHARGWIGEGQLKAGHMYSHCHRVLFGSTAPKSSSISQWYITPIHTKDEAPKMRDADERVEYAARCRERYDQAEDLLTSKAYPRTVRMTVRKICLSGLEAEHTDIGHLTRGLTALMQLWGIRFG